MKCILLLALVAVALAYKNPNNAKFENFNKDLPLYDYQNVLTIATDVVAFGNKRDEECNLYIATHNNIGAYGCRRDSVCKYTDASACLTAELASPAKLGSEIQAACRGKCAAPLAVGDPCLKDSQCASLLCDFLPTWVQDKNNKEMQADNKKVGKCVDPHSLGEGESTYRPEACKWGFALKRPSPNKMEFATAWTCTAITNVPCQADSTWFTSFAGCGFAASGLNAPYDNAQMFTTYTGGDRADATKKEYEYLFQVANSLTAAYKAGLVCQANNSLASVKTCAYLGKDCSEKSDNLEKAYKKYYTVLAGAWEKCTNLDTYESGDYTQISINGKENHKIKMSKLTMEIEFAKKDLEYCFDEYNYDGTNPCPKSAASMIVPSIFAVLLALVALF